jgi:hypothetical protein
MPRNYYNQIAIKKNKYEHEHKFHGLWEKIKKFNIWIHGVEGAEIHTKNKLFDEIITENFPNLEKDTDIQVWKAYQTLK